jgi:PIN domain nuclease of toxin-antitoxin system
MILDASALLAYLHQEKGCQQVEQMTKHEGLIP